MKTFDVYLRTRDHAINIYLTNLLSRYDVGIRHRMILRSNTVYLLLGKIIIPEPHEMILNSDLQLSHFELFGGANNVMILDSSTNANVVYFTKDIDNRMILKSSDIGILSREFTGGDNKMTLRSSSINGDVWTVISFNSSFILSSQTNAGFVQKFPKIHHANVLSSLISEFVELLVYEIANHMTLDSKAVNASIGRYRLLSEMDDEYLDDFDDMLLQDVDFIYLD
jgi:hypothetical protein